MLLPVFHFQLTEVEMKSGSTFDVDEEGLFKNFEARHLESISPIDLRNVQKRHCTVTVNGRKDSFSFINSKCAEILLHNIDCNYCSVALVAVLRGLFK